MYPIWGGGGFNPIFAHGKMCVFPFFPMGKNGKKSIWKEGKVFISLSFHILFSPFFPMGKNRKTHIFPWAKMRLDPPPHPNIIYSTHFRQLFRTVTPFSAHCISDHRISDQKVRTVMVRAIVRVRVMVKVWVRVRVRVRLGDAVGRKVGNHSEHISNSIR